MKRNIFKALLIALALPLAFVMTSCEKQPDSKELYVYLNTEIQPINHMEMLVDVEIRKPGNVITYDGKDLLKFNVKASRPLPASATCKFAADASKLADYNKQFDANAVLLPDANVQFNDGAQLTIKEGSMFSADSLEVRIVGKENLNLDGDPTYVYPINLVSVSSNDKGLRVSSNHFTVYIVIKVASLTYHMEMVSDIAMTGNPLAGSNVTATVSGGGASTVANLLDGKASPSWYASQVNKPTISYDLGESRQITGLRLWQAYQYARMGISKLSIKVSSDNVSWTDLGDIAIPLSTGNAANPVWQYVQFYDVHNVRYVKFQSLAGQSSSTYPTYAGLSELQMYVQ